MSDVDWIFVENMAKILAEDFLTFVNASPSPFHAVQTAKERLVKAGFEELKEKTQWTVKPSGKYFFTRNASALVAFAVGANFKPGNGKNIIGAHTALFQVEAS